MEEQLALEDICPGVDLLNPALLRGGILVLHYAQHLTAVSPEDTAVACGIIKMGGDNRGGSALLNMVSQQLLEGFAAEEGGCHRR